MSGTHSSRRWFGLVVVTALVAGCGQGGSASSSSTDQAAGTSAPAVVVEAPGPTSGAASTTLVAITTTTEPAPPPTLITSAPSTLAPPDVTEVPGSQLTGEAAFLGPILRVPVGGLVIAYRQFGSGPDLLLIAGQAAGMSTWPLSTLRQLSESNRVTIYDNRDLGDTDDVAEPFTLSDLADDSAGLIEVLALERPAVFGWSTGGEIGLLLAIGHPGSIGRLAISGAGPGGPATTFPPQAVIDLMTSGDPDFNLLLDSMFSPLGRQAYDRWIGDLAVVPQPPPSVDANQSYDAAEHQYWTEPTPNLAAIVVPVLVMNGTDDYIAATANSEFIAAAIGPNAHLELDAGGRHGWFIEHPEHFAELMAEFLGQRVVAPQTSMPGR